MLSPLRLDIAALTLGSPWLIDEAIVKSHARIDMTDDDDLLEVYLRAAIGWAESATQRVIYRRQCRWVLREFPYHHIGEIRLPCGLAQSVSSIAYVSGGQNFTLTGPSSGSPGGTDYQEDLNSESGGVLMPLRGNYWPNTDCDAVAPVTITFNAGWDADDVPAELQHAILFAVEDMYDSRGTGSVEPSVLSNGGSNLAVREALVSPYRLTRIY